MKNSVQTIELTSKRLKLQRVLAVAVTAISFFVLLSGLHADPDKTAQVYSGFAGMVFGLAWQCAVQVQTWWNHA